MKKQLLLPAIFLLLKMTSFSQVIKLSFTPAEGLYSVHCINYDTVVVVGENGYIIRTTNSGLTWNTISSNTTNALYKVSFVNKNTGYAVGAKGTILKTTDKGQNWSSIGIKTNMSLISMSFINKDTGWVVGGDLGYGIANPLGTKGVLMKTTNGGAAWFVDSSYNATVNSVFFIDKDTGYISANQQSSPKDFQFLKKTINGGSSFVVIKKDSVYGYYTDAQFINAKTGYYACSASNNPQSGIYKTTDYGNTWNSSNNAPARNLFVLDSCVYYYSTSDLPGAWFGDRNSCLNINHAPIPQWVSASILNLDSGFAVTVFPGNNPGRYIYKWQSKFVGVTEITASGMHLFPNPFKDKTTISFNPDINISDMSITVWNSLGQAIIAACLIKDNHVSIDLSKYSNGVYYLFIKDKNNIIQSNKLIKH